VVNNSLAAAGPTDPLLRRRALEEVEQIRRVTTDHAGRVYVVPRLSEEPRGVSGLRAMIARSAAAPRSAA
jgi:arsenite/tail-anchored protein-transporting ATPase